MAADRTMTRQQYAAIRRGYRDARRADRIREADDAAYRDGPRRWKDFRRVPGSGFLRELDAELALTCLRPYQRQDAVVTLHPETRVALSRLHSRIAARAHQQAVKDAIARGVASARALDAERRVAA